MFVYFLKFFLPILYLSSGFSAGFFLKDFLKKEDCLKMVFSQNENFANQEELEEITKILNEEKKKEEESPIVPISEESKKEAQSKETGEFVGSLKSDKFYPTTCHFAKRIKEENKVWFGSVKEGEKAGRQYVSCNN